MQLLIDTLDDNVLLVRMTFLFSSIPVSLEAAVVFSFSDCEKQGCQVCHISRMESQWNFTFHWMLGWTLPDLVENWTPRDDPESSSQRPHLCAKVE